MRLVWSVLVLFLSYSAHAATAESCTTVDLRKDLGPVRNQDGVGWCYAFSAADMITFKNKGRAYVSASDVATQYISQQQNISITSGPIVTFGGGVPVEAMKIAAKKGVCTEASVPSEVNRGSDIYEAYYNLFRISKSLQTTGQGKEYCAGAAQAYQKFFPSSSPQEIARTIATEPPWRVVAKLQSKNCPTRYSAGFGENDVTAETNKTKIPQVIKNQFDLKKPVMISYPIKLIMKKHPTADGMHASVLVGRKFNAKTKKCEYLIRNSFGRSCDGYNKSLKCESGNIWVAENDLFESVADITYFK
nr:C1 family peptidase [uncultured Bdellovibrio sp.]